MVLHGFIFIENRRVNIPSYIVKEGQTLEIRVKDEFKKELKETIEINSKERSVPDWMEVDNDSFKIKIVRLPEKEDISTPVNEQFIVELYSK